ncbi:helix-turn-helix transcriptional regulator [Sulfurospirillum oryzae]|uniref:helix-turn-helix transcriptional regulator n=1 Tax=Sulfurospirillum oryzae TaxID=2976535 RepID=UPI0021E72671|nr:DNA-binding protein [Sulfurospirillum oryzae]
MPKQTLPQRLRAKQVAAENSIGLSTVWRYAKLGKLTPIRVTDGVTVFDRDEVNALFGCKTSSGEPR